MIGAFRRGPGSEGVTLIELVCTTAIVAMLAMVAIPVVKTTVKKQKELELRRALRLIRTAIDDYKRTVGDNPQFAAVIKKAGAEGYPPDLETLVSGTDMGQAVERKIKFLRRIPIDPMTGEADWILRSNRQEKESDSWDRQHVFDVRTRSPGIGLDGSKYADW
jgi:general secretion pathway protein G